MAIEIKINNHIKEVIQSKVKDKLNNTVARIYAVATTLTPVSKSVRARTTKNKLVISGRARVRRGHTGGRLRKGWGTIAAELYGDNIVAYVYNNTHYAGHVNFGHRTRLGTGKKGKTKKNGKKYVEGRHMIEQALENVGIDPKNLNINYKK